jgi:predicted nuclease of restriction endonuclease-like RecB superfamily
MNIIFNCGISGSGKSSYTAVYCKEHPNTIVVNRDSVRVSLFSTLDGYYQSPDVKIKEEVVTQICETIFLKALYNGYSIIVDNTNLNYKYIENFIKIYERNFYFYTKKVYQIQFKLFDVELNIAKKRVLCRDFFYEDGDTEDTVRGNWTTYNVNNLPEVAYIEKQFTQYQEMKAYLLEHHKHQIV